MLKGRKRRAAFEREALPHINDLYRTASRLIRNAAIAEDLVQEAYIRAWKAFDRYELGTNARAWLFTILLNVVRHHRRSRFRIEAKTCEIADVEQTLVAPVAISPVLEDRTILDALDDLQENHREVILLADVEEFTYREIAGILDVPIGTVMSRLSRARAHLRSVLFDTAVEYGIVERREPS